MRKEAIGIAINDREIKIAHVFREKNVLAVDYLESAILMTDIENEAREKAEDSPQTTTITEQEDAFALDSPQGIKAQTEKESGSQDNVEALTSLLLKFSGRKIKVAFNISPSRVTYQDLDTHLDYDKNAFKGKLKAKIDQWKQGFNALDNVSIITRKDGTLCNVICDTMQAPTIVMLEQLNAFYNRNLYLALMDPNEVSLVNLVRNGYDFHYTNEISIIVQMEAEFSRIIFMKANDLLTVSPIIPEGFTPEINETIYSKIIYELDNLNISEITNLLLAGKANSSITKTFFEKKFPDVRVGFIISQPLAENLSTQYSREDLSEYAIPIALAWKVVDNKSENFIPTNLLSSEIIDRQKILKLNYIGYLLLILLGITAFILTWKIMAQKIDINSIKNKNIATEKRINSSEETVKKVEQMEEQIVKLGKQISFSDSLSQGSDRLLSFLEKLNQSVLKIKSVWIDEIQNVKKGVLVKGMTLKRGSVPEISELLGGARIRKLTRTDFGIQKIFNFEMEVDWTNEVFQSRSKEPQESKILQTVQSNTAKTKIVSSTISDKDISKALTQTPSLDKYVETRNHTASNISRQQSWKNLPPETKENSELLANADNKIASFESKKNDYSKNKDIISNNLTKYSERKNISVNKQQKQFSDQSSNFTIRMNAHVAKITARDEVQFYRSKGYETYITTFLNGRREIPYWICYGDFSTYQEAEQVVSELQNIFCGKYDIINTSKNKVGQTVLPSLSELSSTHNKRNNNKLNKEAKQTISLPNSQETQESANYVKNNVANSKKTIKTSNRETNNGYSQSSTFYASDHFTISISAHVAKITAKKENEFFNSKGFKTYIISLASQNPQIRYWVCYGNYESYSEAEENIQKLNQIIKRNYDIVTINN